MQLPLISHATDCERLLTALRGRGWVESRRLYRETDCMVHSRVADLRRRGYDVECRRFAEGFGAGDYRYKLISEPTFDDATTADLNRAVDDARGVL